MNEKKLKLLIKRQRSLRTYIDCKSKLELKMNENQRKNMDIINHLNISKEKESKFPRNSSFNSNKKLSSKPKIIKDSNKSGINLPKITKSKFIPKVNNKKVDKKLPKSSKNLNTENNITVKENNIEIIYNNKNSISLTQKGFFFEKNIERKNNQDCSLILEEVCGIKNYNIYSIMDGHGSNGHLVSNFIKQKIILYFNDISFYFKKIKNKPKDIVFPENILELIKKKLTKNNYQKLKEFFKAIDESLSSIEVSFDSNFSGSTCILIFQLGSYIISCNIGDSRALLIKDNKDIIELSKDHKPDNEEEKKRIIDMGGIVSQCNDLYDDGKIGGPFRVWMKGCDYPGLAMSRSIGDKIAHSIGVINEPEIKEFNIKDDDKFIIMGSDGVWQFLNNNDIINILFNKDINWKDDSMRENICKNIINKAKNNFFENDEYIDDITVSLIFLK